MARRLATAISQAPGLAGTAGDDLVRPGLCLEAQRLGRAAGLRPFGEGDDQRVLRQILGKVDIPHHAGQARDEPGPFNAKGRLYCLMSFRLVRFACGHTALLAKAAGETSQPAAPKLGNESAGRRQGSSRRYQATPSFPRSPSRGAESSSGVINSARIRRLVERPDFDLALARHGIGAALRPGHGLVHVLDLPD